MSHIKVYHRKNVRFQQHKLEKQIKKTNNNMKLILENWNNYVNEEQIDEGLQEVIASGMQKFMENFKKMFAEAKASLEGLDLAEAEKFLDLPIYAEAKAKLIELDGEVKTLSTSVNESVSLQIKDRKSFDQLLREEKQQINEVWFAAIATKTHDPVSTFLAVAPFVIIKIGQILNFFGKEAAAKKFISVGEKIEAVMNISFGRVAFQGFGWRLCNFAIKASRKQGKFANFCKNYVLPSSSKDYWANPETPLIQEKETSLKTMGAEISGAMHDIEHHVDHLNKVDEEMLLKLAAAPAKTRQRIFGIGGDLILKAVNGTFTNIGEGSSSQGYSTNLEDPVAKVVEILLKYCADDSIPLPEKIKIFLSLKKGTSVKAPDQSLRAAKSSEDFRKAINGAQTSLKGKRVSGGDLNRLNSRIKSASSGNIFVTPNIKKGLEKLEKAIANSGPYQNFVKAETKKVPASGKEETMEEAAASHGDDHSGGGGQNSVRQKAIMSWIEKLSFIATLIFAIIAMAKLGYAIATGGEGAAHAVTAGGHGTVTKEAGKATQELAAQIQNPESLLGNLKHGALEFIKTAHEVESAEVSATGAAKVAGRA